MQDLLEIHQLKLNVRLGVHAWEQRILQPISLDLSIPWDAKNCNDQLEKTLDYDKLCQTITDYLNEHSFQLLETMAETLALFLKKTFKLPTVTLKISKLLAIPTANAVSLTITR